MRVNQQTMKDMAADILLGRYPRFVYGRKRGKQEAPPVLCYHQAQPEQIENLLRFLNQNSYETLDCDTYYKHITGEAEAPERSVLLTFDDGWGSMWSVLYPLLKKYQLKAVVFLIPGRIQNNPSGVTHPTLDDVQLGNAQIEQVLRRDTSREPLATWQELREMHASGHFDFQSHTLLHDLIITDPTITGFVTPEVIQTTRTKVLSLYDDTARKDVKPKLGAPLYKVASRMLDGCRVEEDAMLREQLEAYVDTQGGDTFFETPDWESQLRNIVNEHQNKHFPTQETGRDRDIALYENLSEAKQLIEENLPGKTVRHLAFPWGQGSEPAVEAAKRAGYTTCFWGKVDGRLRNTVGVDPYRLTRIGEDFAELLPGVGRKNLTHLLYKKLRKRF